MRRPRRNHSSAFKATIALAALTSDATTAALTARGDAHAHQITQWKQQLVAAVFSGDGVRTAAAPPIVGKALQSKIGQQALELDFFGRRPRAAMRLERQMMINPQQDPPVISQAALRLSRSTVYSLPRAIAEADLSVIRHLDTWHLEPPFAGSRTLHGLPRGEGVEIGRDRVRTLLRRMGISAIYRRPRAGQRHPKHPIFPHPLRGPLINRPNRVWATDIAYIPMARDSAFPCAIIDWASRKVLARRISAALTTDCCIAALEEAIDRFGAPETFDADQRSQFIITALLDVLCRHHVRMIVDGRRSWRDIVIVEWLWRWVKYEDLSLRANRTVTGVRPGLKHYFTFFLQRRAHTALDGRTFDQAYTSSRPNPSLVSSRANVPKQAA
jgi:putative transposase